MENGNRSRPVLRRRWTEICTCNNRTALLHRFNVWISVVFVRNWNVWWSFSSRETNSGCVAQPWKRHRDVLRECCVCEGRSVWDANRPRASIRERAWQFDTYDVVVMATKQMRRGWVRVRGLVRSPPVTETEIHGKRKNNGHKMSRHCGNVSAHTYLPDTCLKHLQTSLCF